MVSVRRLSPQEWSTYRDLRLAALADSPDAFGRTLAEEQERTDWSARLGSAGDLDLPLTAEVDGRAAGLAWGKIFPEEPRKAHVFQMWVAPAERGHGIGRALLNAIVVWAQDRGAEQVELGVTAGDTPALRLYERAGFRRTGQEEALRPGSKLTAQILRLELTPD